MRILLLVLGGLISTAALGEPVEFNLPAQTADRALLSFSRQASVEVLFPFSELSQVRSSGVMGRFERETALRLLLAGTGFAASPNGRGAFVITPVRPPPGRPPVAPGPTPGKAEEPSDEATRLDPFLVRGQAEADPGQLTASNVPTGNLDLPRTENDALPYQIYGRDRIATSGAANLNDFLRQEVLESEAIPALDEGGAQPGFTDGSTNLNLRGFGSDQTVILIDGLPMPQMLSGGITNGTTATSREADVNLIPINLVERIEVLPVSASALYSGNPVGGVINIVLRPIENIDELAATYSNGTGIDAPRSSYSLLHGQTLLNGKLSFRLNANFTRTTPANEAELGFVRTNLREHPDIDLPPGYPGTALYRATPNVTSDSQTPLFGPGTSSYTSVAPGASGAGGLAAFAGRAGLPSLALFRAPGGMASSPDSLDFAYGRRQATSTYFGSTIWEVSPRVELGLNGLYSHTVTNPGYDLLRGNLTLAADSPFNPFGQLVDVRLNEAAPQLGEGYDEAHIDLYSALGAILIRLPDDWRLSLDAQYSRTLTAYRGLAGVDSERWQQLVDQGAYNPLRDTQVYGPPPAFYNQALLYFGSRGRFITLDDFQSVRTAARLTRQTLPLPTGTGAVSAGADYGIDHSADFNDLQRYGDGSVAPTSGLWQGRTLQTVSAFAELQAPVLPGRLLPSWMRRASIEAAARYNASDVPLGTNVSPTAGVKIDLVSGFSLRASISKTNRFPTPALSHFVPVVGGSGSGAVGIPTSSDIVDPRRGGDRYTVTTSQLPVTNLRPEADLTQSAGIIFQRGRTHRFRFAVDMIQTRKSGELQDFEAQDVIGLEGFLPGRVTRANPAPGDPFSAGMVTSILTGPINVAWRESRNWNTAVDYTWFGFAGGEFQAYARWLYFAEYRRAVLGDSPLVDELNQPDTSTVDLLRHRVNFGAAWANRRFGFGVDGQYISSRVLPSLLWADQGGRQIRPFFPFATYVKSDLARCLHWNSPRFGLVAQVRVGNIFAAPLPKFPLNPTGTGVEPYGDWRGRTFSLSVTATY